MRFSRWRYKVAQVLSWSFPRWCWADLMAWVLGDRAFREIDHDCRDLESSSQPRCFCGKNAREVCRSCSATATGSDLLCDECRDAAGYYL